MAMGNFFMGRIFTRFCRARGVNRFAKNPPRPRVVTPPALGHNQGMRFRLAFLALSLLTACASAPRPRPEAPAAPAAEAASLLPPPVTVEEILRADAGIEPKPHVGVPMEINVHVREWIEYFTTRDRARFQRFLDRGGYYRDAIESILEEHGVPTELFYVAMIESGFVAHARSHAAAVGPWQIMKGTGRDYGLKASREVDERRDIIRATHAAARYLRALHDEFDSWYLALAAYNAGPGRIRGVIRRGGSRDYWELHQRGFLPRETMDYVPKFLAAAVIGRSAEKYGFRDTPESRFPVAARVRVPGAVPLKEIARVSGITLAEARRLNPHLLREATPRDLKAYPVWVPKERAAALERARPRLQLVADRLLAGRRIAAHKVSLAARAAARKPAVLPRARTKRHRVRAGETLTEIAEKYGLSVPQLKRLNSLRGDRVLAGQRLLVSRT
jgi:membrane-bound lytic murein transglycosylase D